MAKKTHKTKKTEKITRLDVLCIGILVVNFLSLAIHNVLLPWIYLLLVVVYVIVNDTVRRAPQLRHWLAIAYAPVLVSLYYLDFALSCATLLAIGLANYYAVKERK